MLDPSTTEAIKGAVKSLEADARERLHIKGRTIPARQGIKAIRWTAAIKTTQATKPLLLALLIKLVAATRQPVSPSWPSFRLDHVAEIPPKKSKQQTRGPNRSLKGGLGSIIQPSNHLLERRVLEVR